MMSSLFGLFLLLLIPAALAACTTSANCGSTTPYCVNGQCVGYCKQDSDCQSTWADSACISNLCTCYNEAQCAGSLFCSRTAPTKGRCVTCETSDHRGCLERSYPICQANSATVNLNGASTTVTTYSCRAPTSSAECLQSTLMVSRDRLVHNISINNRCISSQLYKPCSSSDECTSASAWVCSSGKCNVASSRAACANYPGKNAWIDNSCVECTTNSDCAAPLPVCDVTTYSCVSCYGDSECPTEQLCINNQCQTISCTTSNDCFPAYPQCAVSLGICKACSTNANCISWLSNGGYVCDLSTRTCVPAPNNCIFTDNCTAVTSPVCSNHLCVACTTDTDCANKFTKETHCSSGTCVECISNSECLIATTPICSSNQCVPCSSDGDCMGFANNRNKCNLGTGACVECIDHSHCTTSTTPICSLSNECTPCTSDANCMGFTNREKCNLGTGACVKCLENTHCTVSTTPICSASNLCVPCSSHDDCAGFMGQTKCNTGTGECVECTENTHCTVSTAPICSLSNQCIPCSSDGDCLVFPNRNKCNLANGACSCTDYCSVCDSTSTCIACDPPYYLKDGVCVQDCGSGLFGYNYSLPSSPTISYLTCGFCHFTCKECRNSADQCTACNLPYLLKDFKCKSTLPDLTVTLQQTSNPQAFQLVFSRQMKISSEDLKNNILINFSKLSSSDYTLASVAQKANATIFELTFEFQKSVGVQILNITFINQSSVVDTNGFYVIQSSAQTDTIRFVLFSPQEKEFIDAATTAGTAAVGAAMGSSALIAVITGNPVLMLALIGIFQITNYLLYMNVNYPENVNIFFALFSTSSFDFIPDPIEVLVPELYDEMQIPLTSPRKFLDNEMDARFLGNCGLMLTGWGIVGFSYLVIRALLFVFRMQGLLGKLFLYFRSKFEWDLIISTLIGSYPNLFLAAILQINNLNFQGSLNRGSSIMGLAAAIVCLSAPFLSIYIIDSTSSELGSRSHHERYRSLYNGFKLLEDKENPTPPETVYYRRNFLAIIFIRKMAYLSSLLFMYDIPLLQLTGTCGSGIIILIFMLKFKPYQTSRDAWLHVGSEIILLLIHLVIYVLAGDDIAEKLSDSQRKNVGWVIIGLCSLLVVYNCYFVLLEQIDQTRDFLKYLMKFKKSKKVIRTYNLKTNIYNTSATDKPETIAAGISHETGKNEDTLANNDLMTTLQQNQILLESLHSTNGIIPNKIFRKARRIIEATESKRNNDFLSEIR